MSQLQNLKRRKDSSIRVRGCHWESNWIQNYRWSIIIILAKVPHQTLKLLVQLWLKINWFTVVVNLITKVRFHLETMRNSSFLIVNIGLQVKLPTHQFLILSKAKSQASLKELLVDLSNKLNSRYLLKPVKVCEVVLKTLSNY